MHFWPLIGKVKMCLRSEQFVYIFQLFVYKWNKIMKMTQIFQSCFHGLLDKRLGWYAKGPRFESYPGKSKIYYFYQKLLFFSRFMKIKICQINCSVLKRILALPIRGQKCIISKLFQFLSSIFDLGHPVTFSSKIRP